MSVTVRNPITMNVNADMFEPFGNIHLLRLRSAFRLEIKSGMKLSQGSILAYLNRCVYIDHNGEEKRLTSKRTKVGALADLEAYMENFHGINPLS